MVFAYNDVTLSSVLSRLVGRKSVVALGGSRKHHVGVSYSHQGCSCGSLPEFLDFKLFGKTTLVVNRKFELFLAHQLRK